MLVKTTPPLVPDTEPRPDALRTLIGYVLSSPTTYANLQVILDHVVDEAAQLVLARIAAEDATD